MTDLAFSGAGHIASVHGLAARAAGVTITKVASRDHGHATERAREMGAEACEYADLPAGADIVFVATPPANHVNDAIQALQGGAAAIVEKPVATTLEDADRLVAAAAASGGRVGYAENLAFAPVVQAMLARIGDLGPIHHLELRSLQARPNWGDFLEESWGGGALFDLGAHPIALALLLAGSAKPVEVSANLKGAVDIAADDYAEVTLTFDSGLQVELTVSWRHPDDQVWDIEAASSTGVLRAELIPNLSLEINGEPVALPAERDGLPSPLLERMGYVGQIEAFTADFAAGREPEMNATFARDVLDIICGAYQSSANNGRPRPLPFNGHRDRTPLQLWLD